MRPPAFLLATISVIMAFSLGCSPAKVGGADAGAAGARGAGSGGAVAAGSGGGTQGSGSGGAVVTPTGGASAMGGATGAAGRAGTGGATATGGSGPRGTGGNAGGGAFDDGKLFTDAGVAMASSGGAPGGVDASTPPADARPDGPPGNGHMATCSIPAVGLTAVFTQTGTDVTVVINATACPAGNHVIQIHNGFSCDSAATQGPVWGGRRGDGIGGTASTITCNAQMRGMLTYTRVGTDPATNWTVGDHNTTTDVTLHPMLLDANCGTFF